MPALRVLGWEDPDIEPCCGRVWIVCCYGVYGYTDAYLGLVHRKTPVYIKHRRAPPRSHGDERLGQRRGVERGDHQCGGGHHEDSSQSMETVPALSIVDRVNGSPGT